jgi:hypothetical protein
MPLGGLSVTVGDEMFRGPAKWLTVCCLQATNWRSCATVGPQTAAKVAMDRIHREGVRGSAGTQD